MNSMTPPTQRPKLTLRIWSALGTFALLLGTGIYWGVSSLLSETEVENDASYAPTAHVRRSVNSLFTAEYPANTKYQNELHALESENRLSSENKRLIHSTVERTSAELGIPPALLWCLLFQESRLNHLYGLNAETSSRGLGQFTSFSFYEVNHHLSKFTDDNRLAALDILGTDPRPFTAKDTKEFSPSSYYSIPTAVVASAAFLNNRYLHLKKLLKDRMVEPDSDLLWMHAAAAYNKGTRGVLSIWEEARRTRKGGLERLVTDRAFLANVAFSPKFVRRSFARIWKDKKARRYGKELSRHIENIASCAIGEEWKAPETRGNP